MSTNSVLPLGCNTEDLIATTVDGNYTYIRYSNDGDAGTGFSATYNSSTHNYVGIITSTTEIPSPSVSDFVGSWVEKQEQYTYYGFATDASGTGFVTTWTGSETYLAIINSATELTPVVGDFAGKWFLLGGSTDTDATGEDLITYRKTSEQYPFTQFLIKNEEMDNTLDESECNPITVDSIDTSGSTITCSWLPNIDSIFNPDTDKEWLIFDLDIRPDAGYFYSGGYYTNVFKVTGGSYSTRTLNYTWIGSGTETNTITGNNLALWNPDEDGFTRYTGNPILTGTDFSGVAGTHIDLNTKGIFKRSDGTYILLMSLSNTDVVPVYATSTDLLNWTPIQTEIFPSGRPTWCADYITPHDSPKYLEDEDMYIMTIGGRDATGNSQVGWVKFNEDFTTYKFSPDPILDVTELENIVDGWKTGYNLDSIGSNDVLYASMAENNGVWYLISNVVGGFSGTHNGDDIASSLTDTARTVPFVVDEFDGWDGGVPYSDCNPCVVYNITDGSSGTATDNTATNVTVTLASGTNNFWNYGDEYLIQGYTGRICFISTSDSPYGPFKHHKVIFKPTVDNNGALGNSHMETPHMFIYKGVPHAFINETSATDFSGVKGHRVCSLFRWDASSGEFVKHRKSPVFSAWQYANVGRTSTDYDWEMYHIGSFLVPYVDETNNKLYYFYTAKDDSPNYEVGVAYTDLTPYK